MRKDLVEISKSAFHEVSGYAVFPYNSIHKRNNLSQTHIQRYILICNQTSLPDQNWPTIKNLWKYYEPPDISAYQ